jgi:hypothetical protein
MFLKKNKKKSFSIFFLFLYLLGYIFKIHILSLFEVKKQCSGARNLFLNF